MKVEYDKVFVKYGKQGKFVDTNKITIDGVSIKDLFKEIQSYKEKYKQLTELLNDKVILNPKDNLIIALNDEVHKGKITSIKLDEGENVKILKVEDGKLVKDKKKVGILNEWNIWNVIR